MTEPTDRWRCALAARERQDPLVGTAVPAPRWFLVEHPGPWQCTAAGTAPLDTVATELPALLEGHGARLQLIRRHGRRTGSGAEDGRRGVALVDCGGGEPDRPYARASAFQSLGYRVMVLRDDDEIVRVVVDEVPTELEKRARKAVEKCPMAALEIKE